MSSAGRSGGGGLGNSSQAQGRPVGLPPALERPDQPIRAEQTAASWFAVAVLRPLWLRRRELALADLMAGFAGAGWWVSRDWSPGAAWSSWAWAWSRPWALAAGLVPVLVIIGVPWLRRTVWGSLRRARLVRDWDSATRHAGLTTVSDRVPRIVGPVTWLGHGASFTARLPKSSTAEDVEDAAEAVAVVMDVRQVTSVRDPDRARYVTVYVNRADPFAQAMPDPWPWLDSPQADFGGGIPIGIKESGEPARIKMLGRNLLVGGEPEAGKSVAASQILGAAALDPNVRIWGFDAKLVELSLWGPVLERCAYNNIDDAIDQVRHLITLMDGRYEQMQAAGRRTATPEDGYIHLAAFDELMFFTSHEDSKARKEFITLLRDLVARGRAANFPSVLATQKPATDVVPSSIRDLVGYRWALRCNTRDASDTILGAGMAQEGYDASIVPIATRGVGLLKAESGLPEMCRSHYLSDTDIETIAERGAKLRADA